LKRPVPLALVIACAPLLLSKGALAQGSTLPQVTAPQAPVQITLVPPTLRKDSLADYPRKAIVEKHFEDVEIIVALQISPEGIVTDAAVGEEDSHGFAEAARKAALKLEFTPAMRGEKAVASKIKFRYRFVPPKPVLTVQVKDRDSNAVLASATVLIIAADKSERSETTDTEGRIHIRDLTAGPITIRVSVPGFERVESEETLAFAEETQLVLRAAPVKTATARPPGANEEEVPEEVSVRGERPPREVVKRSLTAQEMSQIPGTNGDALRAVQSLPGVARPPPFFGQLVVRGSENDDTVIYVDGTPIPLVYHFGGLSSVIPTEATEKLDFYPGNFSSVYGRGMGGVVDVTQRAPSKDRFRGLLQLDLVDARFVVESPLGKGWSARAAGRRSWFDAWLGPVLDSANAGISTLPRYYDGQLTVQKEWSADHILRLGVFGADDAFKSTRSGGTDPNASGGFGIATRFWRAQAVYRNRLSERTEVRATGAFGK
jgi:TonB-dependent Receptor Plug Domain/Gram-negative bacterial TonB protein C-terminal/Carboxypeptidase regulatory-like domain